MVVRARSRQQVSLLRPSVANTMLDLESGNRNREKVAEIKPLADLEKSLKAIQRQLEEQRTTSKEMRRAAIGDAGDQVEFTVRESDDTKTIRVPHKLGKAPRGFLVTYRSDFDGQLRPQNAAKLGDDKMLFFQADAPVGTIFRVIPLL